MSRLLTVYETDGTETEYYYGAEGLAAQYNSGTKECLNYHYDNIGSTTMVMNITGTIAEQFAYGTYGELLTTVKNKIRFLYNGSYGVTTDENGLYYMRARYYNPDIKRFINQDIKVGDIGSSQSLNRYAYCEGNPVSLVDPFGLSPESTQDQGKTSKYQWLHNVLDVAGFFFDGADIINAGLYALEGNWVQAGVSIACALPFIGTAVAGVTKATKLVKIGKAIEKTMKIAGKAYMTVQAATTALEMAGDARMEYALTGGKITLGVAALSAGSLIKDVTSLSKAGNIEFNTKSQQTADAESGRCAKGEGIGCFIAGTKVRTEDGEKNIEEVEAGDYVLAENPLTGEQEYKQVVQTYIHEKTTLVHVFIEDEEIITTEEHPFYVEDIGFVSAGELRYGDTVRLADGRKVSVKQISLEYLDEPVAVYNFEVEDFHTYYVSELSVLVHNMCGETTTGATGGGKVVSESGSFSVGDAIFMDADEAFLNSISRRTDVDPNGYFDVVAHGTSNSIQITYNGQHILVDHRVGARLIQNADGYNGQPIRLLSCNTGSLDNGFAQNLANTLNVDVMAPTNYLCARQDGSYFVSSIRRVGNITVSDGNIGEFRVFKPGGNR